MDQFDFYGRQWRCSDNNFTRDFETLIEEFPIDKERITAFGLSDGGTAAWEFVSNTPEQFAGLVVCSSIPSGDKSVTNINIRMFVCTGDQGVSIDQVRTTVKKINQKGGNAFLTELNPTAHDSWTDALNQSKMFAWMITQKKDSLFSPPPGVVVDPKTWRSIERVRGTLFL